MTVSSVAFVTHFKTVSKQSDGSLQNLNKYCNGYFSLVEMSYMAVGHAIP